MPEERISMSQSERERWKVLHGIEQGHWTQVEGARRLHLSTRQVRRLQRRVAAEGDRGVIHQLRGRRSNRKIPEKVQERVLAAVRRRYADFGPTLAAEHLGTEDGVTVDHETLRRWMLAAGLWSRARKRSPHRRRRERKAHFGELVQMDGSFHLWFEDRAPASCLLTLVDDATGTSLGRLGPQDAHSGHRDHAVRDGDHRILTS